jgi:ADP-ribose pyrophosphatase
MSQGVVPVRTSVVFDTPWLQVEALDMGSADAPYYRVVEGGGAICVLLSATGDFVMVRQARPAVECYTLEFPAGGIDKGETAEEAIRREVLEETGLRIAHLQCVGVTEPIPNRYHCPQSMFIGVAAPGQPATKEGGAEVVFVPRQALLGTLQREGMHSIVALGIIKVTELVWSVDLFEASIELISQKFSARPAGARKD